MVKRNIKHSESSEQGSKITMWIALGGLIGLFIGFFAGILFGGTIYFMPILAILGTAIGGTTGNALIQQKSVHRKRNK